MFDRPEEVVSKIMKATTDSIGKVHYDPISQPGISNLINIVTCLTNSSIESIERTFENCGYGEFKKYVATKTSEFIENIQKKYKEIINGNYIEEILAKGIKISRDMARNKYDLMKQKMGLM